MKIIFYSLLISAPKVGIFYIGWAKYHHLSSS